MPIRVTGRFLSNSPTAPFWCRIVYLLPVLLITESIVKNTGTDPKYIYVLFEDIAPSDWAGAGQLFGEEAEKA